MHNVYIQLQRFMKPEEFISKIIYRYSEKRLLSDTLDYSNYIVLEPYDLVQLFELFFEYEIYRYYRIANSNNISLYKLLVYSYQNNLYPVIIKDNETVINPILLVLENLENFDVKVNGNVFLLKSPFNDAVIDKISIIETELKQLSDTFFKVFNQTKIDSLNNLVKQYSDDEDIYIYIPTHVLYTDRVLPFIDINQFGITLNEHGIKAISEYEFIYCKHGQISTEEQICYGDNTELSDLRFFKIMNLNSSFPLELSIIVTKIMLSEKSEQLFFKNPNVNQDLKTKYEKISDICNTKYEFTPDDYLEFYELNLLLQRYLLKEILKKN